MHHCILLLISVGFLLCTKPSRYMHYIWTTHWFKWESAEIH